VWQMGQPPAGVGVNSILGVMAAMVLALASAVGVRMLMVMAGGRLLAHLAACSAASSRLSCASSWMA
jgi:hypothetical protein